MSTGQVLDILGTCSNNADEVIDKPMTSDGTIELTSIGCGNMRLWRARARTARILLTMASTASSRPPGRSRGSHYHDDARPHKGTLDVNVNTTYTAEKNGITNSKGTREHRGQHDADRELGLTGSAFANTKGSITGTGELLVEPRDTFNEGAGTITGTNVLLNGAILEYTGSRRHGAGTIEAEGATSLLAGAPQRWPDPRRQRHRAASTPT